MRDGPPQPAPATPSEARGRRALAALAGLLLAGYWAAPVLVRAAPAQASNLAARLLELEGRVAPVTDAMRERLATVIADAVAEVHRHDAARPANRPGSRGVRSWDRSEVLAALGAIDDTLVRHGFVHPSDGAVDLLSEALTPVTVPSDERTSLLARPENARRAAMIEARFPGPFHVIDCDTAAFVYLGAAEHLDLPLRLVLVPSRNQTRGHAFVRWREGRRRVDWETTEGRERTRPDAGRDASSDAARTTPSGPELELAPPEIPACVHYLVAVQHERRGDTAAARREFEAALATCPRHVDAMRQLAWRLATAEDATAADATRAVALAHDVVRRADDADARDTLAAAHAASGRFDLAIREERAALAHPGVPERTRAAYRRRLAWYEQGKPFRAVEARRNPAASPE